MAASNIIEILIKAKDGASSVISSVADNVASRFENMSQTLITTGAGMALLTAPMVAGLYDATGQAIAFDEAMTNVQAVIRTTDEETAALSQTILDLGASSRYGPQALAESYYEIVGGVADASTHMDILNASVRTAQAGNADLNATTSALISTMNSYGFAAEDAARVSDVLVQIVGAGVGSMDEFAAALPQVTGLAASANISLEDLAGQMAYLTTQGFSASQSATFLRGMITTLQNPTAQLADIIADLGYESGSAMIEAEGLAGAYALIKEEGGGAFDGIITNQEALLGAIALTGDKTEDFLNNFTDGMDGIAAATEAIQMDSPAAQMDLFKSSISALKIEIGQAFIPVLLTALDTIKPVVAGVLDWARENPQLIATVGALVVAIGGLGAGLMTVGGVLGAIAPLIGMLSAPVLAAAGGLALLGLAFKENLFGIQDVVSGVVDQISGLVSYVQNLEALGATTGEILEAVALRLGVSEPIINAVGNALEVVSDAINSGLKTGGKIINKLGDALQSFADNHPEVIKIAASIAGVATGINVALAGIGAAGAVLAPVIGIIAAIGTAIIGTILSPITLIAAAVVGLYYAFQTNFLGIRDFVMDSVVPAIETLADWLQTNIPVAIQAASTFWETALLPALQAVGMFITGTVVPAIGEVVNWLQSAIPSAVSTAASAWQGTLWPALQAVGDFITGTIIPVFQNVAGWLAANIPAAIETAKGFWESSLKPALETVWNFITGSVIPAFSDVATWLQTNIPTAITSVSNLWQNTLKPALETVWNFITGSVIPVLTDVASWLQTNIPTAITKISGDLQTALTPAFEIISTFITGTVVPAFQRVYDFLQLFIPDAIVVVTTAWNSIFKPALEALEIFITTVLVVAFQNIYNFLQLFIPDAIAVLVAAWDTILMPALEQVSTFLAATLVVGLQSVYNFLQDYLPGAIDVLKTAWTTVLQPAIQTTSDFITNSVIPAFQKIYEFGQNYIPGAFNTLSSNIGSVAAPALNTFFDILEDIHEMFYKVKKAVDDLLGSLGELIEDVAGMDIPDWLIPGSPPPLAYALWDVADAMAAVGKQGLDFNTALGVGSTPPPAMGGGAGGGGIHVTINVDAATVNDIERTQQNAERLALEIERALLAGG